MENTKREKKEKGFSKLKLWDLQKDYYKSLVVSDAWGKNVIPFFNTSNNFIANKYAKIIKEIIDNTDEKLYILELGSGHGRFSFLLQNALKGIYTNKTKQYQYIMSDLSQKNLDTWNAHPLLAPFIEEKTLDFVLFDISLQDDNILTYEKESLSSVLQNKNVLLISNFVTSALAFDIFTIKNNILFETNAVYDKSIENLSAEDFNKTMQKTKVSFEMSETDTSYYEDENLNKILEYYMNYYDNATIDIPIDMIQTIEYFKNLSSELSILLSDDSNLSLEFFDNRKAKVFQLESGSFSNRINLDALSRFTKTQDLNFISPIAPHSNFDTYLFVSDKLLQMNTLEDMIQSYSSNDFSIIYNQLKSRTTVRSKEVLALFKMSEYDPNIIQDFYEKLLSMSHSKDKRIRQLLLVSLQKAWDNYYDIGESFDMGYSIGRLFRRLKEYQYGLKAFSYSIQKDDKNYQTYYYLGLCYHSLEKYNEAIIQYQKSIKLKGKYTSAQNNLLECEESIKNEKKMKIIFPILGKGWTKSLNQYDWLEAVYIDYTDAKSIIDACKYYGIYVILPIALVTHRLVIENKNKLARNGIKVLCNNHYAVDVYGNKKEFYKFMIEKNYGEYVPIHYEDITAIKYPCIVKPKYGTASQGIRIVYKSDELGEIKKNELITDYIEGSKEYSTHVIFNKHKVIDTETFEYRFQKDYYVSAREEREIVKYALDEDHLALFKNILSDVNYSGFCTFNFKLLDNKPVIFEINARMGYYLTKKDNELKHMFSSYINEAKNV